MPSDIPPSGGPEAARPAPDAAAAPEDLLRQLRRRVGEGRVALRLDMARLTHIDSPVAVEADSNLWAYALIVVALLAWWRWGGTAALAVAAAGTALYFTLGRAYVRRRIERRVHEGALGELERWRRLWRFGGVELAAPGMEPCRAPEGNWMGFVRGLGADEGG